MIPHQILHLGLENCFILLSEGWILYIIQMYNSAMDSDSEIKEKELSLSYDYYFHSLSSSIIFFESQLTLSRDKQLTIIVQCE